MKKAKFFSGVFKSLIILIMVLTMFILSAQGKAMPVYEISSDPITIDLCDNKAELCEVSLASAGIEETFHTTIKNHELMTILVDNQEIPAIMIDLTEFNLDVSTEEGRMYTEQMLYTLSYQSLEYFYLKSEVYPYEENRKYMYLFFPVNTAFTEWEGSDDLQANLDRHIMLYEQKSASILADCLYPNMTEAEIATALHSYIGEKIDYDYSFEELSFTPYSAIMGDKAVCQGYAFAYKHLLRLVGIHSTIVTSLSMNHAWNIVYIDGKAYHVDCTNDDQPKYGVTHRYFLLSDETLAQRGYHSWSASTECTDKNYESGYFFNPQYTDAMYTNDFMTCRYTDKGYFVYKRNNKYHKSYLGGTTTEIDINEYNSSYSFPAKISAPFILSDESFVFSDEDGATISVTNKSDSKLEGTVFGITENQGRYETNLYKSICLEAKDSVWCPIAKQQSTDKQEKVFFWSKNLQPMAKTICTDMGL